MYVSILFFMASFAFGGLEMNTSNSGLCKCKINLIKDSYDKTEHKSNENIYIWSFKASTIIKTKSDDDELKFDRKSFEDKI